MSISESVGVTDDAPGLRPRYRNGGGIALTPDSAYFAEMPAVDSRTASPDAHL